MKLCFTFLVLSLTLNVFCASEELIKQNYFEEKPNSNQVELVLSMMVNTGKVLDKSEFVSKDQTLIKIRTENNQIRLILDSDNQIVRISRSKVGRGERKNDGDSNEAITIASRYAQNLVGQNFESLKPDFVNRDEILEFANMWSVSWNRRFGKYKTNLDFIKVIFDKNEGLYFFTKEWKLSEKIAIPQRLVSEDHAVKKAKMSASEVIKKFYLKFDGHLIDQLITSELLVIAPNYALEDRVMSELDLTKADFKNPRLAWVISFSVKIDPKSEKELFSQAGGLTVYIDAETGSCIGAEF